MTQKNSLRNLAHNLLKKRSIYTLSILVILSTLLLGVLQVSNKNQDPVDWLNTSDWSYFPGAEKTDSGLHIKPIGRAINHTDTSASQPHPPINMRGSYADISGDFEVSMDISGIDNDAILQLYGEVPVIYDEWRKERGSIRIDMTNGGVTARIWDGSAATSMDQRTYNISLKDRATLEIRNSLDQIFIKVNGSTLGYMPEHSIFSSGKIWFGADASPGTSGWTLHSLSINGEGNGLAKVSEPPALSANSSDPNTLKNLAKKNKQSFPIGAAVSVGPFLTDPKYREIALSEFSMMTIENSLKPQYIQPQRGLYTFQEADTLVEAARTNNIQVHGHALVMSKANPEWMQKAPPNEKKEIMASHVASTVRHFKDRVVQWDVVNEPMSEDHIDYKNGAPGLRKNMWLDAMGEQYIDIAFREAHKADPKAKLYLNDFGLEKEGERWDALIALIKRLQARKVPIHGVGFEAHVYHEPADTIDPKILKKHIKILASMGLESRISEIDVLGDNPEFQTSQYVDILEVCLQEPACTSYGTWGISDYYGSTALSDRYPTVYGDSLLWDLEHKPKPAYIGLQAILKSNNQ